MKHSVELREFIVTHLALDVSEFVKDPTGRSGVKGAPVARQCAFVALERDRLLRLAREVDSYGVEEMIPSLESLLSEVQGLTNAE